MHHSNASVFRSSGVLHGLLCGLHEGREELLGNAHAHVQQSKARQLLWTNACGKGQGSYKQFN